MQKFHTPAFLGLQNIIPAKNFSVLHSHVQVCQQCIVRGWG